MQGKSNILGLVIGAGGGIALITLLGLIRVRRHRQQGGGVDLSFVSSMDNYSDVGAPMTVFFMVVFWWVVAVVTLVQKDTVGHGVAAMSVIAGIAIVYVLIFRRRRLANRHESSMVDTLPRDDVDKSLWSQFLNMSHFAPSKTLRTTNNVETLNKKALNTDFNSSSNITPYYKNDSLHSSSNQASTPARGGDDDAGNVYMSQELTLPANRKESVVDHFEGTEWAKDPNEEDYLQVVMSGGERPDEDFIFSPGKTTQAPKHSLATIRGSIHPTFVHEESDFVFAHDETTF